MSSKAAKRRRKHTKRAMQDLWQQAEGPIRTVTITEDPRRVALSARCRRMGIEDNAKGRRAVDWSGLSHPVGIALHGVTDRHDLWQVFCRLDAVHETYHRRIMGRPRFPMTVKFEMLPEVTETRPDDRIDVRSREERDRDAQQAWQRWLVMIQSINARYRPVIMQALWREVNSPALLVEGLRFLQEAERG